MLDLRQSPVRDLPAEDPALTAQMIQVLAPAPRWTAARRRAPAAPLNTWCADSGLPELERLAGTIQAWRPEVLGFLQTQVTNAAPKPRTEP